MGFFEHGQSAIQSMQEVSTYVYTIDTCERFHINELYKHPKVRESIQCLLKITLEYLAEHVHVLNSKPLDALLCGLSR